MSMYSNAVVMGHRDQSNLSKSERHQRQIDCYVCNAGRYGQKRSEAGALELTQQALTPHGFLDGNLGMDPTVVSSEGSTALIQAAEVGYSRVVEYILERTEAVKGRDGLSDFVNVRDKNNNTALILAARNGHVEVVKTLLEAGADVNAQDRQGYSALMKAAYRGHSEVVHCLLTHENSKDVIDVNARSQRGETALSLVRDAKGAKKVSADVEDRIANELMEAGTTDSRSVSDPRTSLRSNSEQITEAGEKMAPVSRNSNDHTA